MRWSRLKLPSSRLAEGSGPGHPIQSLDVLVCKITGCMFFHRAAFNGQFQRFNVLHAKDCHSQRR
jgi:hypothetical protein